MPYRCLIPMDSGGSIIGKGGILLKRLESEAGVYVSVLKSDEGPRGLDDRLCILNGTFSQKTKGLEWILTRVRDSLNSNERARDVTVCLIPQCVIALVIGSRGAVVRNIEEKCDVSIKIEEECLRGTVDRPTSIKGTQRDTIRAMEMVHAIIQENVNEGKCFRKDFAYCNNFPSNQLKPQQSQPKKQQQQQQSPQSKEMKQQQYVPSCPGAAYVSGLSVRFALSSEQAEFLTQPAQVEKICGLEEEYSAEILIEGAGDSAVLELVGRGVSFDKKIDLVRKIVSTLNTSSYRLALDRRIPQLFATAKAAHCEMTVSNSVLTVTSGISSSLSDGVVAVVTAIEADELGKKKINSAPHNDTTFRKVSLWLDSADYSISGGRLESLRAKVSVTAKVERSILVLEGSSSAVKAALGILLDEGLGSEKEAQEECETARDE